MDVAGHQSRASDGKRGAGVEAARGAQPAPGETAAGDRDVHHRTDAAEARSRSAEVLGGSGEVACVPGTQEVEGDVEGVFVIVTRASCPYERAEHGQDARVTGNDNESRAA